MGEFSNLSRVQEVVLLEYQHSAGEQLNMADAEGMRKSRFVSGFRKSLDNQSKIGAVHLEAVIRFQIDCILCLMYTNFNQTGGLII